MAAKKSNNKKVTIAAASQSTRLVEFVASKDHGAIKKDETYRVSENVADVLTSRGLGKKQEISK